MVDRLGPTTSESAWVRSCSKSGSASPGRYATSRLCSRLGEPKPTSSDKRAPAPRPPRQLRTSPYRYDRFTTPQPPRQAPNNMPASVENLFPLTSVATSAGPNRPRTISAPRHHGHSAGSEPDPNDATASQPHSHPPADPQADPEQHARFRGKPVSSDLRCHPMWQQPQSATGKPQQLHRRLPAPNIMAPGRHHDIRRSLLHPRRDSAPLQIPDPHGSQPVGRDASTRLPQLPAPHGSQTRNPE